MSPRRPGGGAPSGRAQQAARLAAQQAAEQAARRRHDRRVLLVVVAAVVLLVLGGTGVQAWRTQRLPTGPVPGAGLADAPVTLADGQPIRLGDAGAPVVVQLYEDFHCPHCADVEEEIGPTLTAAQQEGEVRLELYPMAFVDEGSAPAANAMACAAEAGFGARYRLGLFTHHTLRWDDDQLLALAPLAGGRADEAFTRCVTTDAHAGWVASIDAVAERNGVTGTPTMVLDGQPVDLSDLTADELRALIDAKR